jgi:hypothetical protein
MRAFLAGSVVAWVIVFIGAVPAASPVPASELKSATVAAFDRYVQLTETRMAGEVAGTSPFLWIDRQPAADRAAAQKELAAGQVVVAQMQTRDGRSEIDVPSGMVHHWIGTVLLPGVPLERVMAFVRDYPAYPRAFGPTIERAQVISASGDRYEVSMRTSTKKVISVVIDATYTIDYRPLGTGRVWTKSVASNIREVQSAGTADERSRPAETGSGYLWRLNNYCSFEVRPEGTYEQCESVSLSRDMPFGIGWIVGPYVKSVPRETLTFTLGHVRSGLVK